MLLLQSVGFHHDIFIHVYHILSYTVPFPLLPSLVPQLVSLEILLLLLSCHIYILYINTHIICNLNSHRGEMWSLSPSLPPLLSLETASHATPGWLQSCYLAEDVLELWSSFSAERMCGEPDSVGLTPGFDPDNSGIIRFLATQTHSKLALYHVRFI